jgi:hypothetical protein
MVSMLLRGDDFVVTAKRMPKFRLSAAADKSVFGASFRESALYFFSLK